MIDAEAGKLKEDLFVGRLRDNVGAVENAGGIEESDNLVELRRLTGGKLLRSELESKYPLGRCISVRVSPKVGLLSKKNIPLVVSGRVIIRLERLVEKGGDEEPVSLGELNSILAKESDLANRSCHELVFGLFSPTGWAEEAEQFIRNEPPGSGWASSRVYPVLIGPEINELAWDRNSSKLSKYVQVFCGLTAEERRRICRDEIQRALLVQGFANLEKIAETKGIDIGFAKQIAKGLCREDRQLKLTTIKDVGLVLKRRI